MFQPAHFVFKGQVRNPKASYDYTFDLFEEVLPDHSETRYNKFGRYLQLNLQKKDPAIWWPRLAKTTSKLHNVRIDWEKWVDDDEAAPAKSEKPKASSKKVTESASDVSESS